MATKQPRGAKPTKMADTADTVAHETSAVAQELAKVQAEALAKTAHIAVEEAAAELNEAGSLADIAEPALAPEPIITETAEAVVTAAETAETTAKKEWKFMATQFEAPKMLTDVSDRAKASFEKTQKFAAEFGDFNKGNIEAMVESGKIAAKGLETMGQDAAEYTRRSFEGMTATIKSLATVKSPTEFMKLQGDYMRTAFDSAVAQSSKNTEAMIKLASDVAQPISSRFAVAVEKVKMAA